MPDAAEMRRDEAARLAGRVVAASAAGSPDAHALADLCALCEAAGFDHADLLADAAHCAGDAVEANGLRNAQTAH